MPRTRGMAKPSSEEKKESRRTGPLKSSLDHFHVYMDFLSGLWTPFQDASELLTRLDIGWSAQKPAIKVVVVVFCDFYEPVNILDQRSLGNTLDGFKYIPFEILHLHVIEPGVFCGKDSDWPPMLKRIDKNYQANTSVSADAKGFVGSPAHQRFRILREDRHDLVAHFRTLFHNILQTLSSCAGVLNCLKRSEQ